MTRLLAVSDEVVESLWSKRVRALEPDLLVGCGDLPYDYLEYLVSTLDVPAVFVPGNHDPEAPVIRQSRAGLPLRAGLPTTSPRPGGFSNADRRIVDAAGLRLAGLGGSVRYRPGPNQYSQRELARRARALRRRAGWRNWRDGHGVDVLLTHSPPAGLGDEDDPPHRGFVALHGLVERLRPALLLHGHIHPHGVPRPDRMLGATRVCNVVGYRVIEL
jgi:calcineurin-like phosphoesterase family protein